MKLREGDTVMVISGKDAGTESKIARVYPGKNRIIVEGVRPQSEARNRPGNSTPAASSTRTCRSTHRT